MMEKRDVLDIHKLILLDTQKKVSERIKKGVVINVGDEHYAQATQILDRHNIDYGNVRDKELCVNAIIVN